VLNLASRLYAIGARARRAAAASRPDGPRRLARPVVSVGNLAVGGTGKTPLVAWIAALLAQAGERPSILSRGYARALPDEGVTVVSDGERLRADIDRAGDEPLMLARALPRVPVVVSPDRYLAGRLAELHLGATVHILDDGFQHFDLARDVDLVLVDPADLAAPLTLPAGRLREPVSVLRVASALVVTDPAADAMAVAAAAGVERGFTLVRESDPAVEDTPAGPQTVPAGSRVVLACGIARPDRFEAESREAGYDVAAVAAFPDHHRYARGDIERLGRDAVDAGTDLVLTTEKDLMRLLPLRPWPFRVAIRPLRARIADDGFTSWLLAGLTRAAAPEPAA
jgi:tetraacyldisaccharide 4'-kinase